MPKTIIQVTCDPSGTLRRVPPEDLKDFQGNLKELPEDQYDKLYASLKRYGFFSPVFIWADHNLILDGHQRLFVCADAELEVEGGIPVIEVVAASAEEASKRLLILSSAYGRVLYEGLYEFSERYGVNFREFQLADIPEINPDTYAQHFLSEGQAQDLGAGEDFVALPAADPRVSIKIGPFSFTVGLVAWDRFLAELQESVGLVAKRQLDEIKKRLCFTME